MEFLLVWFLGALAVGYVASQRGRGSVGWFCISLLLGPLLGILLLIACPATAPAKSAQMERPRPVADSKAERQLIARWACSVGILFVIAALANYFGHRASVWGIGVEMAIGILLLVTAALTARARKLLI